MLAGAIIPKGDRTGLPFEAALIFGIGGLRIEMAEQIATLFGGEPLNMARKAVIDVDSRLAGFRMGPDYRMFHWRLFVVQFLRRFAEPTRKDAGNVMHGGQPDHKFAHLVGQPHECGMHVGEQGITANFGYFDSAQDRTE